MMIIMDELKAYSVYSAAQHLGVPADELKRLIKKGRLKAVNMGTEPCPNWYLLPEHINTYLRQQNETLPESA